MTPRLIRSLAFSLLLVAAIAHAGGGTAIEKEILALEQGFNDAYGANDLAKYFGYYADDFVALFPDEGRTDLTAYRKSWTAYVNAGNRLESARFSDMVIRVTPAGDAAIASYLLAVRTRTRDGKTVDERFHETDVWMKRGGRWQVAHCHYSAAPAAKKPS